MLIPKATTLRSHSLTRMPIYKRLSVSPKFKSHPKGFLKYSFKGKILSATQKLMAMSAIRLK